MPVPFRLGGGSGFYNNVPVSAPALSDNFETLLNEGRLPSRNMAPINTWATLNKQNLGLAGKNLFNQVVSNPGALRPENWSLMQQPGYDPMQSIGGHNFQAQQMIGAFTGQGINLQDDTGQVSLTPGGLTLNSVNNWSATLGPTGAAAQVGPFSVEGGWSGDKYIKGGFRFGGQPGMAPMNIKPISIVEPGINSYDTVDPTSDIQKLKEQTISNYQQQNPYWYRP